MNIYISTFETTYVVWFRYKKVEVLFLYNTRKKEAIIISKKNLEFG